MLHAQRGFRSRRFDKHCCGSGQPHICMQIGIICVRGKCVPNALLRNANKETDLTQLICVPRTQIKKKEERKLEKRRMQTAGKVGVLP